MNRRMLSLAAMAGLAAAMAFPLGAAASPPSNVRVTVDTGSTYISADMMGGTGSYTDATLQRCGIDQRMQNEPTVAIDPRNPAVQTSGSNEYCTVPTNGDAWAGFYRSTTSGSSWTDSLLPGYPQDNSPQGLASPVHTMTQGGALAAGDPVQAWDNSGRLFYMGNNFNRGVGNGKSVDFRDNTGDVWVATYEPSNPDDTSTDGARYVRTVILARNTFGLGSFNDKTAIGVDPVTGDVYAAWSDFHGSGCNQIDVARSTDHGASFSAPMKVSGGLCSNQGPNWAFGPAGQVYLVWAANNGGSKGQHVTSNGFAFVSSLDGVTFTPARIAVQFTPFVSDQFSGNGARECGDPPFNCPTGFTFPRFDLAYPTIATDGSEIIVAFQDALPSGQGQIQYAISTNGGGDWTAPVALDPQATGHQLMPWLASSGGVITAIYYDSRLDTSYAPTRAPCNDANGVTSACLAVWSSTSSDGGATWSHSEVTDALTNPNLEQFGGRLVPFFGDYIEVAAVGSTIEAVWTDQRDAVVAPDTTAGTDNDGADVAGDPETGGSCTSSLDACFDATGGLNQNIYSAALGS